MDVAREPQGWVSKHARQAAGGAASLTALLLVSWGMSSLRTAAPTVESAAVWIDTAQRGALIREVTAPGTLVPESIQFVTAPESGRVEAIYVAPGERVEASTVLLRLENPDLELQALEASRELKSVEADLITLKASLELEKLAQEAVVTRVETEQREVNRRARVAEELAAKGIVADLELAEQRESAADLTRRSVIEVRRAAILAGSAQARLSAGEANVERLRALAEFRAQQVESLTVRANLSGVLQEIALEKGQRVTRGQLFAKVVQLERLRADLRVPEAQAKEVRVGQTVQIDMHATEATGVVARIDPSVQNGTVAVDVEIREGMPAGVRSDQSVEGRIELERLEDVLHVGRPAFGRANQTLELFVLDADGDSAVRAQVRFGGGSVGRIQVLSGLEEGDRVILSDMSDWDEVDRIDLE